MVAQELPQWLLQHIPAIADRYRHKLDEHYEDTTYPSSAYFMFSFVVKPHLEDLQAAGHEAYHIFGLLEHLAVHGDASIQNELGVTLEEMDSWQVWRFLGSALQQEVIHQVTWLPTHTNAHVNQAHYRARWLEEVQKIGGWE